MEVDMQGAPPQQNEATRNNVRGALVNRWLEALTPNGPWDPFEQEIIDILHHTQGYWKDSLVPYQPHMKRFEDDHERRTFVTLLGVPIYVVKPYKRTPEELQMMNEKRERCPSKYAYTKLDYVLSLPVLDDFNYYYARNGVHGYPSCHHAVALAAAVLSELDGQCTMVEYLETTFTPTWAPGNVFLLMREDHTSSLVTQYPWPQMAPLSLFADNKAFRAMMKEDQHQAYKRRLCLVNRPYFYMDYPHQGNIMQRLGEMTAGHGTTFTAYVAEEYLAEDRRVSLLEMCDVHATMYVHLTMRQAYWAENDNTDRYERPFPVSSYRILMAPRYHKFQRHSMYASLVQGQTVIDWKNQCPELDTAEETKQLIEARTIACTQFLKDPKATVFPPSVSAHITAPLTMIRVVPK